MGQLTSEFIDNQGAPSPSNPSNPNLADKASNYRNISTDAQLKKFCAFSIVFSPEGSVAKKVKSGNVMFSPGDKMFNGETKLWDFALANNRQGITAFTMFNYQTVYKLEASDRITYLNENGQFLPVNMHTGQLFDRY